MPQLGINAIDHLVDLLHELRGLRFEHRPHTLLTPPTANLGTIVGGIKTNVVPDRATATVDLRTLPGQRHDELVDTVLSLAARIEEDSPGLRIEVRVVHDLPAVETAPELPLVQAARAAVSRERGLEPAIKGVSYYTDASVLTPASGLPTIIFGPGDERLCHQPNEQIPLDQVFVAARSYAALALELARER